MPNFTRTLTNAQLLHSTLYTVRLFHAPVKSDKSTGVKAPCRMLMQMTPDHSLFNWSSNSGNFGGKYYQLSEPNSHHLSHYKANTTREIWWRKKKNLRNFKFENKSTKMESLALLLLLMLPKGRLKVNFGFLYEPGSKFTKFRNPILSLSECFWSNFSW